ncbi:MAG TPA: hypothetical protein VMO47_05140 [Rhodothermales bacterium]|nr:hypothetical protein [Rhodothermales bacterium]
MRCLFGLLIPAVVMMLAAEGAAARSAAGAHSTGISLNDSTADSLDDFRSRFLLDMPSTVRIRVAAVSLPGSSVNSPTAYGADFRDVFAIAVYQDRTRYADRPDGAAAVGLGLGDSRKAVGLEFAFTNYNVFTEADRDETRDVSVSAKVHRQVTDNLSLAVGVENGVALRGEIGDSGTSYYGVATRNFRLRSNLQRPFSMLTASAGIGNGRFRSERQIVDGDERLNVFGSLGIQVVRALGVVADWTGQDLNAGLSIAPLKRVPFIITAAYADVTGRAGDGARLVIGVGYGYSF